MKVLSKDVNNPKKQSQTQTVIIKVSQILFIKKPIKPERKTPKRTQYQVINIKLIKPIHSQITKEETTSNDTI